MVALVTAILLIASVYVYAAQQQSKASGFEGNLLSGKQSSQTSSKPKPTPSPSPTQCPPKSRYGQGQGDNGCKERPPKKS